MSEKLKVRNLKDGTKMYFFWCPACEQTHSFHVAEGRWSFNDDFELPSFSPSLQYGDCHLFLRDGVIEYCKDCRHGYRGLDVPLQEF